MRKLVRIILCVALCFCISSCSQESEKVSLDKENLSKYLSIEVTFGEVSVADNESPTRNEKYYLTCLATLSVKPKGDYTFEGASISCVLNEGGRWSPIKKNDGMTAVDSLYDWHDVIKLDKEGYGETIVHLFCYSNTYDKMHPASAEWECYATNASGSVTSP